MKCPYCLAPSRPKEEKKGSSHLFICPNCKRDIPASYVNKGWREKSVSVGLVGFPGHGKTVYLTSLFYLLKFLKQKWANYYYLSLDDNTHKIMHIHVPLFEDSQLPGRTQANFPEPSLTHFQNIPNFGDLFLSAYDTGGEVFENTQMITEQGRFVAHSDIVFFNISITECSQNGKRWQDSMESLLDTYVRAVNRMDVKLLKRQHLVVVITKGDSLIETSENKRISPELADYLITGSFEQYVGFENERTLRSSLKESSRLVRGWLINKECRGFINAAEDNFRSVKYTLVSSTGAAPEGMRLKTKLTPQDPKRVLDPFLWTLCEIF